VEQLEKRLDEAIRAGKRQAAPFSKGPAKASPARPGRKGGHDQACRPVPERVDEVLRAALPAECPHCRGEVRRERLAEQYQTEIPPVRPVVTRFDVEVGRCRRCGRRVQGRHPRQTSTALGAAAHSIGPNALALCAHLSKPLGLSAEKIAFFFEAAFGLHVAPSTLTRGIVRCGRRLEPLYRRFIDQVRHSDTVTGDETGWKVGGVLEWLWTFATPRTTVYSIRPSRGADVLVEILTEEFDGVLVHDGWRPYNALERAEHQTCSAHLLRRADGLLEEATRGAVRFPRAVKGLLQDAIDLRDRRDASEVSPHGLAVARGLLEGRLNDLLEWNLSHEGNRKFQKHLAVHRDEILTFLRHEGIEATNWRAEQAIRPAVVIRKVNGGNRTRRGAHATEVLMTFFRTARARGENAVGALREVLCAPPHVVPAWALGP
jgi:transposase